MEREIRKQKYQLLSEKYIRNKERAEKYNEELQK